MLSPPRSCSTVGVPNLLLAAVHSLQGAETFTLQAKRIATPVGHSKSRTVDTSYTGPPTIELHVQTLTGKTIIVGVAPANTIYDLKAKIQDSQDPRQRKEPL